VSDQKLSMRMGTWGRRLYHVLLVNIALAFLSASTRLLAVSHRVGMYANTQHVVAESKEGTYE
jgi:hypothetical protein